MITVEILYSFFLTEEELIVNLFIVSTFETMPQRSFILVKLPFIGFRVKSLIISLSVIAVPSIGKGVSIEYVLKSFDLVDLLHVQGLYALALGVRVILN